MPKERPSALNKAMDYLACRPLSQMELLTKLRKAGYPDPECDAAVGECVRRHYLDDDRLADDAVASLRTRNLGGRQIRQRLMRRGLDGERISELLEAAPEAEEEAARRALEGKLRLLSRENDPRKKREKLFRFMTSRGFAPGMIFKLLGEEESGA